jgi:hypothetical protein
VPMLELPTLSIVWDESERLNFIPVEE